MIGDHDGVMLDIATLIWIQFITSAFQQKYLKENFYSS